MIRLPIAQIAQIAIGEDFLYCVKAAGYAGGSAAVEPGMRPTAGPAPAAAFGALLVPARNQEN